MSAEEDAADVARVLAGDVSAFEAVVGRCLFALATNLYRTEIKRLPPLMSPFEEGVAALDRRAGEPILDEERRDRVIRNAVLALPAKYRDALTLFYFHGMDIARSAACLGVPEGTIKARLSRGRDILRSKLPSLLRNPR